MIVSPTSTAPTPTLTSVESPWKSVMADASGVARCQSLAIRGYPDVVSVPEPKSVLTRIASDPIQATFCFASGRKNPPLMNWPDSTLNSRISTASAPPRERNTRHSRWAGGRQVAPLHDQATSRLGRASPRRSPFANPENPRRSCSTMSFARFLAGGWRPARSCLSDSPRYRERESGPENREWRESGRAGARSEESEPKVRIVASLWFLTHVIARALSTFSNQLNRSTAAAVPADLAGSCAGRESR